MGGDVFADGADCASGGLAGLRETRAPVLREGRGVDGAKDGALERLEARLEKLAELRSTEAQVLRAIAGDLRDYLDVFARLSPDADVEYDRENEREKTAAATRATLVIDAPAHEHLLDANALAKTLAVSPKTIRRWRDEGRLPPAIDLGGVLRWRRAAVDVWLAQREEALR